MKKLKKQIDKAEYVSINGIEQFLLHGGTNAENPVLLFLHGGPGSAESVFAYTMRQWEDIFTVVHWDQRGAGKTYTRNPDIRPDIDMMLDDLYAVIQYLKKEYGKQKIALLGHSWGSVLGSTFIRKYPEEVSFYIGVGQVISMYENERVGYEKLKECIREAGDNRSTKKLVQIGDYPGKGVTMDAAFMKRCEQVRKLQGKYGLAMKFGFNLIMMAIKSPIIGFSDIVALRKAFEVNKGILEGFLGGFDLNAEQANYEVPVYYVLGGDDWQTPIAIAQEYFGKINAPDKKLFVIPGAGHFTMLDQPGPFFTALSEIHQRQMNA